MEPCQPDPIDVQVGRRIAARRREVGLSQAALAAHLRLSFQQVQKYEVGRNRVAASTLVRIAERLDTTVGQLVGEVGEGAADPVLASLLANPHAMAMLDAYAEVPGQSLRGAVVRLVQVVGRD